jgi:selenocysteine lyase/cysteine desulfurase
MSATQRDTASTDAPSMWVSSEGGVSLAEAETAFRRDYPAFETTRLLDELRASEYARLDRTGQVYLDYTGGGLYADSQVREHAALLTGQVFGNPHSTNPTSLLATQLVEQARTGVQYPVSPVARRVSWVLC